jgi:hypothetical protein
MNINQYRKLDMKLRSKGWDLRAPEIGSFAYGRLIGIDNLKVVGGDWAITVYPPGHRLSCGLYFNTLRQVQRWADNGFKDEFLPKIPLEDGTFKIQKKVA